MGQGVPKPDGIREEALFFGLCMGVWNPKLFVSDSSTQGFRNLAAGMSTMSFLIIWALNLGPALLQCVPADVLQHASDAAGTPVVMLEVNLRWTISRLWASWGLDYPR